MDTKILKLAVAVLNRTKPISKLTRRDMIDLGVDMHKYSTGIEPSDQDVLDAAYDVILVNAYQTLTAEKDDRLERLVGYIVLRKQEWSDYSGTDASQMDVQRGKEDACDEILEFLKNGSEPEARHMLDGAVFDPKPDQIDATLLRLKTLQSDLATSMSKLPPYMQTTRTAGIVNNIVVQLGSIHNQLFCACYSGAHANDNEEDICND